MPDVELVRDDQDHKCSHIFSQDELVPQSIDSKTQLEKMAFEAWPELANIMLIEELDIMEAIQRASDEGRYLTLACLAESADSVYALDLWRLNLGTQKKVIRLLYPNIEV